MIFENRELLRSWQIDRLVNTPGFLNLRGLLCFLLKPVLKELIHMIKFNKCHIAEVLSVAIFLTFILLTAESTDEILQLFKQIIILFCGFLILDLIFSHHKNCWIINLLHFLLNKNRLTCLNLKLLRISQPYNIPWMNKFGLKLKDPRVFENPHEWHAVTRVHLEEWLDQVTVLGAACVVVFDVSPTNGRSHLVTGLPLEGGLAMPQFV